MLNKFLIVFIVLCSISHSGNKLALCAKGKLLFEENFESKELPKNFRSGKGEWVMIDGKSIRGKQQEKDKHTAFRKIFLNHQDAIYQFDFKFEKDVYAKFLINYELVHLASCNIKKSELSIIKLSETKKRKMMEEAAIKSGKTIEKGDWEKKNIILDKKPLSLEDNKWYTVTIELIGDLLSATVGEVTVKGRHAGLKERKTNFGIQSAGLNGYTYFDNLRVWKAVK